MKRNKMMNDVIRTYGIEAEETIEFCIECETLTKAEDCYLFERYCELMGM